MASVLNRTTLQYIQSANTPDYPVGSWVINPDLSAVVGFASKYWILTGDVVTLMGAAARAAVDAAEIETMRDTIATQLQQTEDVLRAFMLTVLDELNLHAAKINSIMTAVDNSTAYGNLKSGIVAIADYPTRTESQLRNSVRGKLGT